MFLQLRPDDGTGTLTYIIADDGTGDAAVVDPTLHGAGDVLETLRARRFRLAYIIDTHTHADHVSGAARLREETGARLVMHEKTKSKVIPYEEADRIGIGDILRENEKATPDVYVTDGDEIAVGGEVLRVLHTPGHTDNHICLVHGHRLLTGDLLLIGQAGRADLPGGDPAAQFDSFRHVILPMDDETIIYPGHDYAGNVNSTLGYERVNDPFLRQPTLDDYRYFMREFFPPVAEVTDGRQVTLQCGATRVHQSGDAIEEISTARFRDLIAEHPGAFLLDVREEFELQVFGAIPGVRNIPLGELERRLGELPADRTAPIVAVCQTGSRSYEAAFILKKRGYTDVRSLTGGTSAYLRETAVHS